MAEQQRPSLSRRSTNNESSPETVDPSQVIDKAFLLNKLAEFTGFFHQFWQQQAPEKEQNEVNKLVSDQQFLKHKLTTLQEKSSILRRAITFSKNREWTDTLQKEFKTCGNLLIQYAAKAKATPSQVFWQGLPDFLKSIWAFTQSKIHDYILASFREASFLPVETIKDVPNQFADVARALLSQQYNPLLSGIHLQLNQDQEFQNQTATLEKEHPDANAWRQTIFSFLGISLKLLLSEPNIVLVFEKEEADTIEWMHPFEALLFPGIKMTNEPSAALIWAPRLATVKAKN